METITYPNPMRDAVIRAAALLLDTGGRFADSPDEYPNPEYARGQVQLILDAFGYPRINGEVADIEEAISIVWAEIAEALKVMV